MSNKQFVFTCILAIFSSCCFAQTFNITVCVKTKNNAPITGVKVQIGSAKPGVTNESGCVTISLERQPYFNKEVIVSIKCNEYQPIAPYQVLKENLVLTYHLLKVGELEQIIAENEIIKKQSINTSNSLSIKKGLSNEMSAYEIEKVAKENRYLQEERKALIASLKIQTSTNAELTKYMLQQMQS